MWNGPKKRFKLKCDFLESFSFLIGSENSMQQNKNQDLCTNRTNGPSESGFLVHFSNDLQVITVLTC